jgi:hypothetical protein
VIEEGLLSKRRVVDFTKYQGEDWADSEVAVVIPTGTKAMRVGTYRSTSMCPTPCLSEYVSYPFQLVVKEPVMGYHLKVKDMTSTLSTVQMQRIRDQFRDEPNDQQVVKMWVAEHQTKQSQLFKQKCGKEVREMGEKVVMNETDAVPSPSENLIVEGTIDDSNRDVPADSRV